MALDNRWIERAWSVGAALSRERVGGRATVDDTNRRGPNQPALIMMNESIAGHVKPEIIHDDLARLAVI